MFTASQIVAHLVGDYLLQSDWMANEKTKGSFAAAVHALTYALPFLFFGPSLAAFAFIVGTHFVIDRWRLARYVVWAKNHIAPLRGWFRVVTPNYRAPSRPHESWGDPGDVDLQREARQPGAVSEHHWRRTEPWAYCRQTGYSPRRPAWLATWLLIIADNTLHLICNAIALRFL